MIKIGMMIGDRYEILEKIGTGGMSDVYKAKCHKLNRYVAIKVLKQEFSENANFVSKFRIEAQAAAGLMHPNIVNVYDVGEENGIYYIVMELVEGITLKNYIERKGKLTVRETTSIAIQVAMGIEAAHNLNIVHRDIKPQNIMLLDNGQLRMMDFGIARISRAENQLTGGKAMGSVHYISPEQAKGDETDFTSDIYSVGVMMYEMLSGHLPFDADDVVEVAIKQISDKPQSLQELAPNVPHGLVEITERAMAKRPDNRYASAAEMLSALNAYVENPAIVFNYTYLPDEIPEKVVERPMKTQKDAPEPKKARKGKKKRTIFLPVLFGITVAFALACLALCWAILNDSSTLMSEKADVVLADYSGMTQDEVNAQPQVSSGQITVNWEQSYSNDYAAGYVYKQSPVAGRTVREGQSVTLTVSLGIQSVTVPDVTNYLQADAEQQLKNLGVSVLVTQAVEPTVASGSVIRTDPAAGSQVAAGSTVVVYVSRPQVSTTAKVPSLVGLSSVNDARTLLVQNKLGLGSTTEQYSDKPAGTILAQNPAAGSTVKVNGRVSVTVSAGPEPEPEVPEEPASSAESSDSASSSGDWWSGLVGGSSSSGSSSTGSSPLTDWWTSLLS